MLKIKPEQTTKKIVDFLRIEIEKAQFKKVIIALSGGVDSATVAFLAVKALGIKNVLIAQFPYQKQDPDCELVVKKLQILKENIFETEISKIVNSFARSHLARQGETLRNLRVGNLMARVRMILLYDLAKANKALVIGTENKSEYLLGYFTRFGDEASDLEPIRHLYKIQVGQLAEFLGVPKEIIKKVPTAGLWSNQTDENELGFSYQEADPILLLHFDQKKSWEEIMKIGFKKELVEKIKKRVEQNEFKHNTPKIL